MLRVSYFLVSLEKAIRKLEQELSARQDLSMAGNKSICSIAKWALSQLASRKTFVTQLSCNLQRATCNTLMCQQQDSSATTFYASAAADVQPDVSLDVSLDVSPMSSFPKYSPRSICVLWIIYFAMRNKVVVTFNQIWQLPVANSMPC